MTTTISYDEAFAATMNAAVPLGAETVSLANALGRILAEDICSDLNMPPFNKSAMDGYACRRNDLVSALQVVEEIPAGRMPTREIGPGECAKIMTGAPVPEGADCVVMVEFTELDADGRVRFTGANTNDNICRFAEDIQAGDVVLHAGACVTAAHVAVLATVGCVKVPVYKRPTVGIIATGSELVEPEQAVAGAQIRNSNSFQLMGQAAQMSLEPRYFGIAEDTREATLKMISEAVAECDVVVLSGGVSMGDFDFVPGVLQEMEFRFVYESVAMQPGRPTVFAVNAVNDAQKYVFGLPGNPVSTFVIFEILLKSFLYRLMGHTYRPIVATGRLVKPYRRKKAKRQITVPVRFRAPGEVELLEYHGSAHINALCLADGFITIPVGKTEVEAGAIVHVRCL